MIRDYDKKMEVVLDFYNQSQEILSMVHENIESFNTFYGYDLLNDIRTGNSNDVFLLDEDLQRKGGTRKKVLLTDLGKVGEFTLKYILLLKQMKEYPNQSFEEFNSKPLYGLAERGTGNTYINQYHMDSDLVSRVRESKDRHTLQPLHDYDYLFEMLGILYPEIVNDIYKSLELSVISNEAEKSELVDWLKVSSVCFPKLISTGLLNVNDEVIQRHKDEFLRILRNSGDSFTRLRYLANNPNNKQYSLSDTLGLLDCLTHYTRLIHEANYNELGCDVSVAFSKDKILEHKKKAIVEIAPEDGKEQFAVQRELLDELFSMDRVKNNIYLQETIGLRTNLTLEQVKELLNSNYSDDELYLYITNNLSVDKIEYFYDNGISSWEDIVSILYKYDMSFERVSEINGDELPLYISLDEITVNHIKQYPSLFEYVKESPSLLVDFFGHSYASNGRLEVMRRICDLEVIQEHPSLLALLDNGQLLVYKEYYGEMPDGDVIVNNIKENIEMFKDDPILSKLPLMFDADNNKKIYELLAASGLEEASLDNLDSSIFCLPIAFVMNVATAMEMENVSLINNGNLNSEFYDYANSMRNEPVVRFKIKNAAKFEGLGEVK